MIHHIDNAEIEKRYAMAREQYAAYGVDTETALARLALLPISLQCWQGDDVGGFEGVASQNGGGIQATGNYPGKARNADELRQDADMALRLIPGKHRFNLHAMYAETGGKKAGRNKVEAKHFSAWADWAKEKGLGLDFNPTCFAHPMADGGFTLSSADDGVRKYWIEHCIACRKVGESFGKALGTPCVTNLWIPDGYKDTPADRLSPRERLMDSLDEIYAKDIDPAHNLDAVEGKLFGIGSESFVVGSHEFYLAYALTRGKLLCMDAGHYHPTESLAEKLSAVMCYMDEILLHVSRGVRWDSDHVVILNDDLRAIAEEIVRNNFTDRIHIGLDFFDASINRIAAWVLGTRAMLEALLIALLEPVEMLKALELGGDYTARLALMETIKLMPFGAVWDYYCVRQGTPPSLSWMDEVKKYERDILAARS